MKTRTTTELNELIDEYLDTLDNYQKTEDYGTAYSAAAMQLCWFVEWLETKKAQ